MNFKDITDAPLSEVIKGAASYVGLMVSGLVVLVAFPEIATWLPTVSGLGR